MYKCHCPFSSGPSVPETFCPDALERQLSVRIANTHSHSSSGHRLLSWPFRSALLLLLVGLLLASDAHAAVDAESRFVLNSFAFLVWGVLVMWMCAGFTMLEAGVVRTKNASVICLKNVGAYSIAGLTFYLFGYNLMYTGVGDWIGTLKFFHGISGEERALLDGGGIVMESAVFRSHSTMSGWFFQMVFVATCASIVSGALAERVKLWSFFLFTAVLTGIIYPTIGAWTWGGGWLARLGFQDFAGSTIVHSTGGWAALAGVIIVGARSGKFRPDGSVKSTPPSNVPAVTLGVFILWFGWFGFNGGSQLSLGSAADAIAVAGILVNTNLAAGAGVMAALFISKPVIGRVDLLATLNGAIGGLVAITAAPDIPDHNWAIFIGAVGGIIVVLGLKAMDMCRLDDVVGAVPAHLLSGIWGTLAALINSGADFLVQLIGIASIGAFTFLTSLAVWWIIDKLVGARISMTVEILGQDAAELGIEAYPEFVLMPDADELQAWSDELDTK